MHNIIVYISQYITNIVEQFGYIGIIFAMALESSLLPLPSEIVMIPAGFLVKQGQMNFTMVIIMGTLGSYIGSIINYWIARYFGRTIIIKYGKYFLLPERKLHKMEIFFTKYGSISIFIARLLPVVRHFISIPAGLAKMNIRLFTFYTIFGSFIWVTILTIIGYIIGNNIAQIHAIMPIIKIVTVAILLLFVPYILYKKYRNKS